MLSEMACVTALTYNPYHLLTARVCLLCQFALHLAETLNRLCEAARHSEMVADGPINCEPRDPKLQADGMSKLQRGPGQNNTNPDSGIQGISP